MNQGIRPAAHFAIDEQGNLSPALSEMVSEVDTFALPQESLSAADINAAMGKAYTGTDSVFTGDELEVADLSGFVKELLGNVDKARTIGGGKVGVSGKVNAPVVTFTVPTELRSVVTGGPVDSLAHRPPDIAALAAQAQAAQVAQAASAAQAERARKAANAVLSRVGNDRNTPSQSEVNAAIEVLGQVDTFASGNPFEAAQNAGPAASYGGYVGDPVGREAAIGSRGGGGGRAGGRGR
jgi:hypothetical protein